jgi:hypothetical protein
MYHTSLTFGLVIHSLSYLDKLKSVSLRMDDLLRVMQIIDSHSNVLPEGDYLELCKHLKNAYNKRADPVYFFDYEDFRIHRIGETQETFQYFYDYYFDKALNIDSDFIQGQITYLRKELLEAQPIKRITKRVKERVIKHYCYMNGLGNEDVEIEFPEKDLQSMCRAFVDTENDFRLKYRTAIEKRLEWLEQSDDRLDDV